MLQNSGGFLLASSSSMRVLTMYVSLLFPQSCLSIIWITSTFLSVAKYQSNSRNEGRPRKDVGLFMLCQDSPYQTSITKWWLRDVLFYLQISFFRVGDWGGSFWLRCTTQTPGSIRSKVYHVSAPTSSHCKCRYISLFFLERYPHWAIFCEKKCWIWSLSTCTTWNIYHTEVRVPNFLAQPKDQTVIHFHKQNRPQARKHTAFKRRSRA